MKARVVQAVVLESDDGQVTDIFFSQTTAGVMLGVQREYAQDDPDGGVKQRAEIKEAMDVVIPADLPIEITPADSHYSFLRGQTDGLQLTQQQLLKSGNEAVPVSPYPGFALCCFVRTGHPRTGLRVAFSKEAARGIYDSPFMFLEDSQREVIMKTIAKPGFPFPEETVELDKELQRTLISRSGVHR